MADRIDYEEMAARYDAGRDLAQDGLGAWRDALALHLEGAEHVADIGAGTGVISLALAEWFEGIRVTAVEPADAMRAQAIEKRAHPRIRYVAGTAERLPLTDGSVDVAWLSAVLHHVDREKTASELGRVLRPGGRVLVRGVWPGRTDGITLFRFFQEAANIVEQSYPRLEDAVGVFAAHGLSFVSREAVPQRTAHSMREFADKVATRADTTLTRISDAAFSRGLDAVRAAASRSAADAPVIDALELVVFSHA